MRIREINITEFAGLKNYRRTFTDGVNVIFENNGFGKTTIASFIRAMLYGFPKARSFSVSQNMRLKMTPWSGSDFGGTLTVETDNGGLYRIERIFSGRGFSDILNVIDVKTGAGDDSFMPVPGEKLLGVGGENFERCVYAPQSGVKTGNDLGMTARLGRALEENGGGAALKKALKALEDYLAVLASEDGRLKKISAELNKVERQIKAADARRGQQLAGLKQKVELKAKLIKHEAEIELLKTSRLPQIELNKTAALYQRVEGRRREKQKQLDAMNEYLTDRQLTAEETGEIDECLKGIKAIEDGVKAREAAEIERAERQAREAAGLLKQTAALRKQLKQKRVRVRTDKKLIGIGLLGGAGIFLAAGIFMFAYGLAWVGGVFFGLAAAAGAAGFFFYRTGTKEDATAEDAVPAAENDAKAENKAEDALDEPLPQPVKNAAGPDLLAEENQKLIYTERALSIASRGIKGADSLIKLEAALKKYDADIAARRQVLDDLKAFDETLSEIKADLHGVDEEILSRKFMEADFDIKIPQKRLKYLENSVKTILTQLGQIEGAEAAGAEATLDRTALVQLKNNLLKDKDELETVIYNVDSAIYHLSEGRERLQNNYAPPLTEKAAGYISALGLGKSTGIKVDSDLNIRIETDGELHDIEYYSQGIQDLTYFSLRMAMLDIIYKTERPFIVLDEPFVNLDDPHMEMARSLLKKIGGTKQIIYMTSQAAHNI